jgi:hypothetical protein
MPFNNINFCGITKPIVKEEPLYNKMTCYLEFEAHHPRILGKLIG